MPRLPKIVRNAAFRFALAHTIVFVISVAAVGLSAEALVTRALRLQAQQRVEEEIAELKGEFQQYGRDAFLELIRAQLAKGENRLQFLVVSADGKKLAGESILLRVVEKSSRFAAGEAREVALSRSDAMLVARQPLAEGMTLLVADDMRSIEDVEDVVSSAFYVVLAISALLGLLAGVILSTGLLRRVDRVTHAAEAIIAGDLTRRIEITEAGDEFDHLSSTLNTMLDRINGLMESLHQVSNDIAHDLRTPLARLRQNLEEARTRAETTVQYEAAVDKAIAEADGLLATFSALLRIAQIDAGTRRSAFTRVDLSECLQTVAEAYLPSIEDNGRSLSCSIEPDLLVEGDDQLLTQLFSNLLENAIGHTPSGTAIRLELCQHAAGAGIAAVIADDGPGIPADEAKKVFRRFYRLEKSRSTPGNGLGLSAVAAIVDLHKAKIVLADNRPGLRVKIIFPNKS